MADESVMGGESVAGALRIGLCLAPTWLRGQPASARDPRHAGPADLLVSMARRAEAAKLDFVFKPDSLALLPGMAGTALALDALDPTLLLAAIARETRRIGLVTTVSTTFNPPYVAARQLLSLHWLSEGRAGWNIVTAIDGAGNFGHAPMPAAEVRYARAAEFTDVVRRLWRSHPAGADEDGRAIAPMPIDHHGAFFDVQGPLNVPAHPSGEMALFQAGASDVGRQFAASVADAVFAATPDLAAAVELRADLRRRARALGRDADAVRVLPGLYCFIADRRDDAWAMYRDAHAHLSREWRVASVAAILGLDLAALGLGDDDRVDAALLPDAARAVRSRTHADLLRRYVVDHRPTVRQLLARPEVIGSAHWVSVGTPDDVRDDILRWHAGGAIDGFIAMPGGAEASLARLLDDVVPALVRQRLFRQDYAGTTLRDHLGLDRS